MSIMKTCHITTVHQIFDDRIFIKECKSLLEAGYEVHLIVQNDKDELIDGIYIHGLPKPKNRLERIMKLRKLALKKAIEADAEIYHFHDPELIPVGLKLKKLGKKVIYDVHEDVPRQILSKPYLNKLIKPVISKSFEIYENYASQKFDAIIAATPHIRDRFIKLNSNTIDVNNFPKLNELYSPSKWEERINEICYIGGIAKIRGIIELVKALEYVDTTLHLAGSFESEELKQTVMNLEGWKKVKYYDFVNREQVKEILAKVKIGVVTFYPLPNHIEAQPAKMFEYMSAGIPVIASNFPLWKEIIEKNHCGICVDPLNPLEIAKAIEYLLNNDDIAKNFGENGRKLVENKYNWENERDKLIYLYGKI